MNWKKLLSIGALTMFSASIATGQGTTPTIVQGDYISNVFGNSNFIKNPNAKLNNKDVTVSNATVTRSTTTPLVATSEFLVTTSTSTGSATWSTRTFDAGMKGQNCEARFTYRGFSVGSTTAQILQGANVVAQLTLTPSTDPRIASINFPCGDLSSATTFRLQQATASLTGTNEIGGIYVGLATNMANVAQATRIGGFDNLICPGEPLLNAGSTWAAPNLAGTCTGTATGLASAASSNLNTLTFAFNNLPVGEYLFLLPAYVYPTNITSGTARCDGRIRETTLNLIDGQNAFGTGITGTAYSIGQINQFKFTNPTAGNRIFQVEFFRNSGNSSCAGGIINVQQNASLYRFPSSSELVVTPERQNTWAAIRWSNSSGTQYQSVVNNTWTSGSSTLFSDSYATAFGKASLTGANSSQIRIPSMPVGYYRIKYNGSNYANTGTATPVFPECRSRIFETSTSTTVSQNAWFGMANVVSDVVSPGLEGVFYNSAVGDRTFRLDIAMSSPTTGLASQRCGFFSGLNETGATSAGAIGSPWMIVQPLDQPSNSALYVQGPVKAAISNTAIPTDSIGGKVIDATASKTTTVTGTWQVASSNYGTPTAGSYIMVATIRSQGGLAGLTNSGFIINENGSSVTPVICQASTTSNNGDGVALSRMCYYTTDGTKTLYGWFRSDGANSTINGDAILIRLN